MRLLGIDLKEPSATEMFVLGTLFTGTVLLTVFFAVALGTKTSFILPACFVAGTTSLLGVIGIKARDGLKQTTIIAISSVAAALTGYALSMAVQNGTNQTIDQNRAKPTDSASSISAQLNNLNYFDSAANYSPVPGIPYTYLMHKPGIRTFLVTFSKDEPLIDSIRDISGCDDIYRRDIGAALSKMHGEIEGQCILKGGQGSIVKFSSGEIRLIKLLKDIPDTNDLDKQVAQYDVRIWTENLGN